MVAESKPGREDAADGTYLLVVPWSLGSVGGVNQVVVGLYDGIKRLGGLVPRIMELSWEARRPVERTDAAGRELIELRLRCLPMQGSVIWNLLRYLAWLPAELLRIRRLVRRYDVRIVNAHYLCGAEPSWIIARKLGVFPGKVLLSVHGLDIRTVAKLRGIRRLVWRWTLSQADALVACSVGLAEEMVREFDLPIERIVTIHNGVDAARLLSVTSGDVPPRCTDDAKNPEGPVLLNLGTFEHKKGHDVLLRAFARVVGQHPAVRLVIMGRRAETAEATARMIEELGLKSHVTMRMDVPHDTALRALKNADMFILSSRNEAFSVALLEAGALGKPVVATNVCGVPELIQDGHTGFVVPSEDVDALAGAILAALENRELSQQCGQRLRELVSTKFTLDATSRNYLRLAGY